MAIAYSKKTSAAFTNVAWHMLEFRVSVLGISPGGGATNDHAILGWVPAGVALSTSGYYMSVGVQDIQIKKGSSVLYATNLDTSLFTTNLVLALRMKPTGSSVEVRTSVYNLVSGNTNLLFEYTATDSSGAYAFPNVAPGLYAVGVVTPLGYQTATLSLPVGGCGQGPAAFALSRFANNAIHQNVSEVNTNLVVRYFIGKRMGRAVTNRLDMEALDRLVERACTNAKASPEDPEYPGLPGEAVYSPVKAFDSPTAVLFSSATGQSCERGLSPF